MKVQGPNRPVALDAVRGQKRAAAQSDAPGAERQEKVRVSSEALVLQEAREPEVPDQDRIARLKQAIVDGSFKIDADRIAEAMLSEEV